MRRYHWNPEEPTLTQLAYLVGPGAYLRETGLGATRGFTTDS